MDHLITDNLIIKILNFLLATMVAWMRSKYPHLVNGAWASSAPLEAQIDFFEYKNVMTRSLKRVGGEECYAIVENAFNEMERLVKAGDVRTLQGAFNLCLPLDLTADVAHFFYEVSDMVAGLIQGHRAGRIQTACNMMKREKEATGSDLLAFGKWAKENYWTCLDMSYAHSVRKYREIDWSAEANRQMRQWIYQTCSEFAWFQTSTSTQQIFGSPDLYTVDYFVGICQDLYDFT